MLRVLWHCTEWTSSDGRQLWWRRWWPPPHLSEDSYSLTSVIRCSAIRRQLFFVPSVVVEILQYCCRLFAFWGDR